MSILPLRILAFAVRLQRVLVVLFSDVLNLVSYHDPLKLLRGLLQILLIRKSYLNNIACSYLYFFVDPLVLNILNLFSSSILKVHGSLDLGHVAERASILPHGLQGSRSWHRGWRFTLSLIVVRAIVFLMHGLSRNILTRGLLI